MPPTDRSGATCGGCGCGHRADREADRRRARAILQGVPRGPAGLGELLGSGLDADACRDVATRIEGILPVRVLPRRADACGHGDCLYVLAGVHRPCLLELRDGGCSRAAEVGDRPETYLRVALSPLGRFAAVQETVLSIAGLGDGLRLVAEHPLAGVAAPLLRPIAAGVGGVLRDAGIALLDFGLLAEPAGGAADPSFESRWGAAPTLWSILFDPAPPTTTREVVV
jgi:hypothetical protein